MKRLTATLAILFFITAACTNAQDKKETTEQSENQAECQHHKKEGEHKNCKEMSPEQKANCEAWKDWDNQTPEKKAELIAYKKEKINEKMAEMKAKREEFKAKREEFKAKWANFDQLDIEGQKALIDEFGCCKQKNHCKHHEGENKTPCKNQ